MPGLILGIDLCDAYSQISCVHPITGQVEAVTLSEDDEYGLIPTVLCKRKGENVWDIGEAAYRSLLQNHGVLVDKLVNLAQRGGSATIENVKYSAEDLLCLFVKELVRVSVERYDTKRIDKLVFTVRQMDRPFLDLLVRIGEACGCSRDAIHIVNHTEAYVYFVLSQEPDMWSNTCCMFDLADDGLTYFEMKVVRGRKPLMVEARSERLEEGFNLNVLDSHPGQRMADTILRNCAERIFGKKIISGVFLTGKGFRNTDWAPNFIKYIIPPVKRRGFAGQHIFSGGAAFIGMDLLREKTQYPYMCLCEGRIRRSVSVAVQYGGKNEKVILAGAGTNWYEATSGVELIPVDTDVLELMIQDPTTGRTDKIRMDLSEFPKRPHKTTRIEVILSFSSEDNMTVRVRDLGFGEFFPGSGAVLRKDFFLS